MKRLTIALFALLLLAACGSSGAGVVAAQDSKKVLFLGTSTTDGAGATPRTSRYVDLVKAARPNNTYTELARSGTTLVNADPAKSWEQTAIPSGHDIVIMQFGTNDWLYNTPAPTFRAQAISFLARVKAANPNARLIWLSPWIPQYVEGFSPFAKTSLWQEHGLAIEMALRTVNGEFIDMDPTGSRRVGLPYFSGEEGGLHHNNLGHRKLADAVLTKL